MIRTTIVLICSVFGLGAAFYSRFGALMFYMWIAFFRPQEWSWFDITALRLSAVALFLTVVPSVLTSRLPTLTHPLTFGTVVFVVSAAFAHQFAVNVPLSWYWLTSLMVLATVVCFLVTLTDTPEKFVALVGIVTGSFAFFTAKAGLVSLMRGGSRFSDGLYGAFSDNNAYAVGACMIICPLLFVAQNVPWKSVRYGLWAAVPLTALTVISTFSRAGFLALVVSGGVYVLLQRRRSLVIVLCLLVTPVVVAVAPVPEGYFDRIQTIQTYEEVNETSALSRLYFWEVALNMAADYPLGIGPWQFQDRYDEYDTLQLYGPRRAVHNSFLQALTETGWMGGVTFVLLFVSSVFTLIRLRRDAMSARLASDARKFQLGAANALLASTVAFLVGGNFLSMAYNDLTWVTFGLVAALDLLSRDAPEASATDSLSGDGAATAQ